MIMMIILLCTEMITYGNESEIKGLEEENSKVAGNQVTLELSAKSSLLMEASTGKVIYGKNQEERLSPASITKIMTLLLIFEELETGKIKLTDEVITSEYAQSMGGSQVFLQAGEIQTVETMIKCIAIASGNDASVAMAEHISGSEIEFVTAMNKKAKSLEMKNTNFEDCNGLSDSSNHYTSAMDVAIMSRELVTKHPQIYEYTTIWMEDIIHTTPQGSSVFGLSNTNKLLKQYQWTTGLKTGSTSLAKFCLSATANKDNIDLIAVVLGAPQSKGRFQDAMTLLNYGYSVSQLYQDDNSEILPKQLIERGVEEELQVEFEGEFQYLDITGSNLEEIEKRVEINQLVAPIKKNDEVGNADYYLKDKKIGSIKIIAKETIEKAKYRHYLKRVVVKYLL